VLRPESVNGSADAAVVDAQVIHELSIGAPASMSGDMKEQEEVMHGDVSGILVVRDNGTDRTGQMVKVQGLFATEAPN
jgi:hypothetical protein